MINLIMRFCFISGVFVLIGCVAGPYGGGVALVNPFSAMSDRQAEQEKEKQRPEVYGPPQIIYRIDKDRYFTLEEYIRCENGKTFYNNKAKGIHVKVANTSGYMFKGRFFWLSSRDDYLAFPLNDEKPACRGSDKGCMNVVAVTTDGGKTLRSVTYGSYTNDPNEDTKDYDMLVTNNGFYLINYWDGRRTPTNGSVDKWTFNPATKDSNPAYPGVTGPVYLKDFEMDVSTVIQEKMQCDRKLEPVQYTGRL
ncbi:MAG: hypothetical protein RSD49_16490 [Hafnia sp.]